MIYMDHAATTMLLPQAAAYMEQFEHHEYANPSGRYPFAQKASRAISHARRLIADSIGADVSEIYFTSGGTESDNWVLKGVFETEKKRKIHMITSAIEHPAVLNACHYLEEKGVSISYAPVTADGIVRPETISKLFCKDTVLVSVMTANNEIGTIQPIREIARLTHSHGALFHTDAVQAYGHLPLSVKDDEIDLLSASGHKFNGPKGVGFLYRRNGISFESLLHGGGQEQNQRAGTENVAGIVGMGEAAAYAAKHLDSHQKKELELRDYMKERLCHELSGINVNGSWQNRLSNNLNCSFEKIDGESLQILLALEGICVSVGSACHNSSSEASHVLLALGLSEQKAHQSLRITVGPENTKAEADYVVNKIIESVHALRGTI